MGEYVFRALVFDDQRELVRESYVIYLETCVITIISQWFQQDLHLGDLDVGKRRHGQLLSSLHSCLFLLLVQH